MQLFVLHPAGDRYRFLPLSEKAVELSNYHEKQIELIAVDNAGRHYTEYGRTGLLREMNYLKMGAAGQLCFQSADRGRLPDGVSGTALHPHHTAKRRERDHPALLWYFAEHDLTERLFPLRRLRKITTASMYWITTVSSCSTPTIPEMLKGHNVYTVLPRCPICTVLPLQ